MQQSLERLKMRANANFFNLGENSYLGRGLVIGLDETGQFLVQVYWIMGRSENSRNRIFAQEGSRLFTDAANPAIVKDPSLILYNAMREVTHEGITYTVVSNGSQTDDVVDGYAKDQGLEHSMHWNTYEPDAPNYTPRITAACYWLRDRPIIRMAIVKKSPWSGLPDRHLYEVNDVGPGFGYCLHTYAGDGNPLPSFHGEPYLVPLVGDMATIARTFWESLDPDNRVSLAVKFIPKAGQSNIAIVNKYMKV